MNIGGILLVNINIENPIGETFIKQDSEQKAFIQLTRIIHHNS